MCNPWEHGRKKHIQADHNVEHHCSIQEIPKKAIFASIGLGRDSTLVTSASASTAAMGCRTSGLCTSRHSDRRRQNKLDFAFKLTGPKSLNASP